jgi:hypothetical protein
MPNVENIEQFLTSVYQGESGDWAKIMNQLTIAALHPLMTFAALRYVMGFPVVDVAVPKSDKSKALRLFDPRQPWRLHGFILSYIELPSPLHLYWQGTSKRNLRTRTMQARIAGFTVRAVGSSEISDVVSQVLRDRGSYEHDIEAAQRRILRSLGDAICVGVFDPNEHVVGFCIGTHAGNVVRTLFSVTSQKGTVRWLCFSGFVEAVSARGARFIIESPPWAFTGGNRIFARRLGFAPARIRSR